MIFFLSSLFLLHKSKAIFLHFEFVYTIPLTPFSSVADQDKDPWHSHCHWSCCQILFHFHTSLRPNANQIRGQCNLQAWIIIQAANYRWVFYHYLKVTYCGGLLRLSTCCQRQHQGRSYSSSKNNVLQLFFFRVVSDCFQLIEWNRHYWCHIHCSRETVNLASCQQCQVNSL